MTLDPKIAFGGVNALTIDVEEHFHANMPADRFVRAEWADMPCRTEANIERVLALLAERDTRATFFVLGWLAERFPEVVRRIVANGHELASYGYERAPAVELGDGPFLADIRLAKAVLEDISGVEVKGFRGPGYSIGPANAWAFDCIRAAGYIYNSNAYASRASPPILDGLVHEVRPGLLDVPMATFKVLGSNWRAGGGESFRRMPYWLSRRLLSRVHGKGGGAATFHIRAWEFDPEPLHLDPESGPSGLPGDGNLSQMDPRIRRLLADFRWDRVDQLFLSQYGVA
jgi:polysaccharide deacetylase family protein (PEP-CTERM system associated)